MGTHHITNALLSPAQPDDEWGLNLTQVNEADAWQGGEVDPASPRCDLEGESVCLGPLMALGELHRCVWHVQVEGAREACAPSQGVRHFVARLNSDERATIDAQPLPGGWQPV